MADIQVKSESTLIKKVGDIANVLAAAGVGFTDYLSFTMSRPWKNHPKRRTRSMGIPWYESASVFRSLGHPNNKQHLHAPQLG